MPQLKRKELSFEKNNEADISRASRRLKKNSEIVACGVATQKKQMLNHDDGNLFQGIMVSR